MHRLMTAALLAVPLLVTSCGGDDDTDDTRTSTTLSDAERAAADSGWEEVGKGVEVKEVQLRSGVRCVVAFESRSTDNGRGVGVGLDCDDVGMRR